MILSEFCEFDKIVKLLPKISDFKVSLLSVWNNLYDALIDSRFYEFLFFWLKYLSKKCSINNLN